METITKTEDTNIWFTANHYFGNSDMIEWLNRPFKSVDKMDDFFINRWNEQVSDNDIVFHLGNFTIGIDKFNQYIKELKGKQIYIVPGSLDFLWIKQKGKINDRRIKIKQSLEVCNIKDGTILLPIVMCEWSLQDWYEKENGAWNIFGKQRLSENLKNSYCVDLDHNNYNLVNFEDIKVTFINQL